MIGRIDMIPVCEPVLNGREMNYVNECLETNWISSAGKYISLFEEKFSALLRYAVRRRVHAIAPRPSHVHGGFGNRAGDEVIIPGFYAYRLGQYGYLNGSQACAGGCGSENVVHRP